MRILTPRSIERTGDDSPASSILTYTWRMSGWSQLGVGLLAIVAAVLGLAPMELQRRIIDNAIAEGDGKLLLLLAGIYLGVVLMQQALKMTLQIAQGRLGESAVLYTRRHIYKLLSRDGYGSQSNGGERVAIMTTEIDHLGGYVGEGPSGALANAATLLGVLGYTFYVEPRIAMVGAGLLLPQVILTPLLQRKINRLTAIRVRLLRELGGHVAELEDREPDELGELFRNRMRIHLWKAAMKAALNLANHLAPLGILLFGGYMVIEGQTTLGVLVAFTSGFERMAGPARELIAFYRRTQQAEVQHDLIAAWMRNGGKAGRD